LDENVRKIRIGKSDGKDVWLLGFNSQSQKEMFMWIENIPSLKSGKNVSSGFLRKPDYEPETRHALLKTMKSLGVDSDIDIETALAAWKLSGKPMSFLIVKQLPKTKLAGYISDLSENCTTTGTLEEDNTIYTRMDSEEHIRKAIRKELYLLNEVRMVTYTSKILSDIGRNLPGMKKTLDIWSLANGSVGLYRYEDGNAYEIEVRPASLSRHKDIFGKYITKHIKKKTDPVTPEEVRQALWMGFGEKADKIAFINQDEQYYYFKVYYNETFDENTAEEAIKSLSDIGGFGKYVLSKKDDEYLTVKYIKGTGDKLIFNDFVAGMNKT
jgi:hypothetical protein